MALTSKNIQNPTTPLLSILILGSAPSLSLNLIARTTHILPLFWALCSYCVFFTQLKVSFQNEFLCLYSKPWNEHISLWVNPNSEWWSLRIRILVHFPSDLIYTAIQLTNWAHSLLTSPQIPQVSSCLKACNEFPRIDPQLDSLCSFTALLERITPRLT